MGLLLLELRDFRIFERLEWRPAPGLNVLVGRNASGKTSLLEAVYLLGTGRSFRTGQLGQVLRAGGESLGVRAEVGAARITLGLDYEQGIRRIHIAGALRRSASELASHLPLLLLTPHSHYEFLNQAAERRAALNWGVFHVEPRFLPVWREYQRLLQQRNAALRQRHPERSIRAWDHGLEQAAEDLQSMRERHLEEWNACLAAQAPGLLDEPPRLRLRRGWRAGLALGAAWREELERDYADGFTHSGPHRADLHIDWQGRSPRVRSSHGQQKLVVLALRLAQLAAVRQHGRLPVLLLDDAPAELDRDHQRMLVRLLEGLANQCLITAVEPGPFSELGAVFHVEHGQLEASGRAA